MQTTVILPCRNAPEILWLCWTHFLAYNARDVAAVVVLDNASSAPGMSNVLDTMRSAGATVIRHEENIGVWASINRGLACCRTEAVLVLTSDLLLGPRAVTILQDVAQQTDIPFLGPQVVVGEPDLTKAHVLAMLPPGVNVNTGVYNGACWLMNWPRLREEVGWFDPEFYVAYGDTDFVERMNLRQIRCGIVEGLPCIHLDKQSRRHDHTEEQDTAVEVRDYAHFAEKWHGNAEVLERHPPVSPMFYFSLKHDWQRQVAV